MKLLIIGLLLIVVWLYGKKSAQDNQDNQSAFISAVAFAAAIFCLIGGLIQLYYKLKT